jgi:hypothetical protein
MTDAGLSLQDHEIQTAPRQLMARCQRALTGADHDHVVLSIPS